MNAYLFGLTLREREILNRQALPRGQMRQLARLSSTLAPMGEHPKLNKIIVTTPAFITTCLPPRYFARGALEKDRNRNPTPLFQLLTESNEIPQLRPIPRNRLLLRTLCRGKGVLKQNQQGHAFLDIDDSFILALYPYLRSQGLVRPPYFNLFGTPDGAHITVIPSRESFFQDLDTLAEIGETFTFEIDGLYSLSKPGSWPEVEEVWFFKVRSPELEKLRKKYFLPSLPAGHSFMIALAVKPAQTHLCKQSITHRISPSVNAA